MGWKPLHIAEQRRRHRRLVLKPAGLEMPTGRALDRQLHKEPDDPHWKRRSGYKDWLAFMDEYYPDGDKDRNFTVYGYIVSQLLVQVLKQCGDELTRENVMKQAASLKDLPLGMLLPGIVVNTSRDRFRPRSRCRWSGLTARRGSFSARS